MSKKRSVSSVFTIYGINSNQSILTGYRLRRVRSSRQEEPLLKSLIEPYVKLSLHTVIHVAHKVLSLHKSLAPPINGWPATYFGHVSPFAPFPLQKLHYYDELIRPCACIDTLASWVFHLNYSLSIRVTGYHVPY